MSQQQTFTSKRFRSRSMDRLLYPDPPKRFRGNHSIESILRRDFPPQIRIATQHGTGTNSKNIDQYVQQLEESNEHNSKFKLTKCTTKLLIKDLPVHPEFLLTEIFQECIDKAMAAAKAKGCEEDRLGCMISSELLSNDVWIPVRPLTENTTHLILNRFLQVAQSKQQDNITLWGQPFTVLVTAVKRDALPPTTRLPGGTGRRRKLAFIQNSIQEHSLIKVIFIILNCLKFFV